MHLLPSADFLQNYFFQKNLSGTLSGYQPAWIQIRTDVLSVLIKVQIVCKAQTSWATCSSNRTTIKGNITEPYIYGVIVYFCYVMSHWTIDQSISFTIDWHYTMAWFPPSLLKTHTCAYRNARRRCAYGSFMKGDVVQQRWKSALLWQL